MKRLTILLLLFVFLTACGGEPQYFGTLWPGPQQATDFTLESADGPVSLSDFSGKIVLLYFGYTFCPDICPSTMTDLAQVMQDLGKKADEFQVIMITVDPERDTPQQLADYVSHFDPSFIGLSGTEEEIAAVAADYGIFYERHEGTAASGYLIDHTARVFVIDKNGEYSLSFFFGMTRDEMASDLRNVLKNG